MGLEVLEEDRFVEFLNRGERPCDYERQLVEKHSDRVSYILEGGFPPPVELEIQPTSLCNLRCKHCFGRFYDRLPNRMGEEELGEIAEKVSEFRKDGFGIETVKFCGTTGDPLMNPATLYGVRKFKDLGKRVILFTNGLYLDRELEGGEYYECLLDSDQLRLSLDSGSESVFTNVKGREGFRRTIRGLAKLLIGREERGSDLDVRIGYVIGKENYQDIVRATKLMEGLGADEIRFRVDFTDIEGVRDVSDSILRSLEESKKYETPNFKVNCVYSEKEIKRNGSAFHSEGRKCFTHHFWSCIGPDCELYACGHRTYSGVKSYGSLLENSFEDLWYSPERIDSVSGLPDKHCSICSPSSIRRNDFMTWLFSLQKEKAGDLFKNN
jgi:MoaA/NifB/PqqE/SkfB family radical SAM enzyme